MSQFEILEKNTDIYPAVGFQGHAAESTFCISRDAKVNELKSASWTTTCRHQRGRQPVIVVFIKNSLNVSRYHPNIQHFETIFWQVSIRTPKFFHHFFVFSDDFDDVILSFAGFILQHQRFGIHLPPGGKECKARKTSRKQKEKDVLQVPPYHVDKYLIMGWWKIEKDNAQERTQAGESPQRLATLCVTVLWRDFDRP